MYNNLFEISINAPNYPIFTRINESKYSKSYAQALD